VINDNRMFGILVVDAFEARLPFGFVGAALWNEAAIWVKPVG
jgi:hypothetical protein